MSSPAEFNPYGLHAIRVPLGMLTYPGLSAGAKLLYGRLALFRGRHENGFCRPALDTLAKEMGASTDTVDRWLGELAREGFIERRRHGRGFAECIFLAHPVLVNGATSHPAKTAPNSATLRNQNETFNSADLPPQFRKFEPANFANLAEKSQHQTDKADSCGPENHHQDIQENFHQENGDEKAASDLHFDDEKKPSPAPRKDPDGDLRDIYRRKKGLEIPRDLERRIWETCELRGVARVEYIDALQDHVPNPWRNPAGFLTDFARKINTKRSRPLETVRTTAPGYEQESGPCGRCKAGYLSFDQDPARREYCECALGRDLQRADKRRPQAEAGANAAPTATSKPPDSSATTLPNDNLHSGRPGVRNVC